MNLRIYEISKPTFYRRGVKSCIDHVYSNCHNNIKNVTHNEILSDHRIITVDYNDKNIDIFLPIEHQGIFL